jgi:serine/threonine protein phosphatase PrpC
MDILSFNRDFLDNSYSNKDVLSAFKQATAKNLTIQRGMSVTEISDVVSEKIIAVIKRQFEETKKQFENKTK